MIVGVWILLLAAVLAGCGESETARTTGGNDTSAGNTICPIMPSRTIDKQFYADYAGKRYYLCCKLCVDQFERNPQRWAARAEELKRAQEDLK